MRRLFHAIAVCALVSGAISATASQAQTGRILVIGDSLMAAHALTGRSIAGYLGASLGGAVTDRSVLGARMIYKLTLTGRLGLSIPAQFRGNGWDWVLMSGGGNDLWLGCGCNRCQRKLDRLIAADGTTGEIPRLWARIRKTGAQVVFTGYLRSPEIDTPIEHCKDEGDELEARIARLAARVEGVNYLSMQDLVPPGDLSYFALDRIHPSLKASKAIAARIANFLKQPR